MTVKNHCIKSKKFCESKHNRGLAILGVLITFSVIALSFLYLFQTNSLVSCNFKIRDHQKRISQLKIEAERMELNIAQWQSPANLERLVGSLNMVEVGEVIYLSEDKEVAVQQ